MAGPVEVTQFVSGLAGAQAPGPREISGHQGRGETGRAEDDKAATAGLVGLGVRWVCRGLDPLPCQTHPLTRA